MARIFTGIDIGSSHVKVVLTATQQGDTPGLRTLATGSAPTRGMRHGYVTNVKDVTQSIQEALEKATQGSKVPIAHARISIGGASLEEFRSIASISLTPSGGEVHDSDIDRVVLECEKHASPQLINRKVVHAIPLSFKVDGVPVLGRAVGMKGSKLTAESLLITVMEQHYADLVESLEDAHIAVDGVMASPLAASLAILTKPQRIAGVVLVNIGAETTSLVVFEHDTPISMKVFSLGSADITNDIALALKISLTEAEQLKKGAITGSDIPQKKIDDVAAARLKEIFTRVDAHLKSIGKQKLLPAGVVITGGGAYSTLAADMARTVTKLPSSVGTTIHGMPRTASSEPTFAVAFGLCRWGHTAERHAPVGVTSFMSGLRESLEKFFRSLLP